MTRTILVAVAATVLTVACSKPEKKPEPVAEKPAASVNSAKAETPPPEAKVVTAGDPETTIPEGELPTQERYEEEATSKMTTANLEVELDALESEIGN